MGNAPVLLIGGHGVTGRSVVQVLRDRHPALPLVIGGRDLDRARTFAAGIGAQAAAVDLGRPDLGCDHLAASAVVVLAKDAGLHAMSWAQGRAIPYIGISSAAFEYGVDAAQALARPLAAPVILAGHWFAGAVVASALDLASRLDRVETVTAGVVIEGAAAAGPASGADFRRAGESCQRTLARLDGAYVWQAEADSRGSFRRPGGERVDGKGSISLDVVSIGAGTGAPNVRVLEAWGMTDGAGSGGGGLDEVTVEVTGLAGGRPVAAWQSLALERDGSSLTALCVVLLLERALGLDARAPAPPGLYGPETLIAPRTMVARLQAAGVRVQGGTSPPPSGAAQAPRP